MGRTTTIYGSLEPVWGTRSREGEVRRCLPKQFVDKTRKSTKHHNVGHIPRCLYVVCLHLNCGCLLYVSI